MPQFEIVVHWPHHARALNPERRRVATQAQILPFNLVVGDDWVALLFHCLEWSPSFNVHCSSPFCSAPSFRCHRRLVLRGEEELISISRMHAHRHHFSLLTSILDCFPVSACYVLVPIFDMIVLRLHSSPKAPAIVIVSGCWHPDAQADLPDFTISLRISSPSLASPTARAFSFDTVLDIPHG